MVFIVKRGRVVSCCKNLRGVISYAGKNKVELVRISKITGGDYDPLTPQASVEIKFADKATCNTEFASYEVAVAFFRKRMSKWAGAEKPLLSLCSGDSERLRSIKPVEKDGYLEEFS